MRRESIGVSLALLLLTLCASALLDKVAAPPLADYGDAPDNGTGFPSLYATTNARIVGRGGPFHTDTYYDRLGTFDDPTTVETDAKLVDMDEDNCDPVFYFSRNYNIGYIAFDLSITFDAPSVLRYVNVLFDQNQNLEWRDISDSPHHEWIVVNRIIDRSPGSSFRCICGPFVIRIVNGRPPEAWLRITLTRVPIDPAMFASVGGWDGSGPTAGFDYGETEDWYMTSFETFPPEPPPPDIDKCKEKSTISLIDSQRCPPPIKIPCDNSKPARFKIRIHNSGCRKIIILDPPNWQVEGRGVDIKPVGWVPLVLRPCETATIEFEAKWTVPCIPYPRFRVCETWDVQAQAKPNWGIDPDGEEFDYVPTEPEPPSSTYPYLKSVLFDHPDWPMFGNDLNHTRYSPSAAPITNQLLWSYTTGGWIESSPAVADGKVYVGSRDDRVYCLDASSGSVIWSHTTGNDVFSSPAVADGRVYVGSNDRKVYCLDASTGAFIWSHTTGGEVKSSPAIADSRVYIGSYDKNVSCLNALTGALIWNYTTGGGVESSPAVANGRVYVGSNDRKVYCLNASTGAFTWSYTTGDSVFSSPAVADNKVYVGSYDRKIYCLSALDGSFLWSYTTGHYVFSSPAVFYGRVFVGSWDKNIYCLNASTGAFMWSYTTGGEVWSSPAIARNKIYVGSTDKNVYCFNATTGTLIWNYEAVWGVFSSPAIDDGKVYIGSYDANVYAFADHDVAVEDVAHADVLVGSGGSLPIVAYVVNHGYFIETVNVTVYANDTFIASWIILLGENPVTLPFIWNTSGFALGKYIIKCMADTVLNETDTADNTCFDGIVQVAILGDVNGDAVVDSTDLGTLGVSWGAFEGDLNWNPICDLNPDGSIDSSDLGIMGAHWGETE